MPEEGRGDDVYQPDGSDSDNRPTDDLDPENVIDEPDLDDTLDTGYSPPEKPLGVSKYGTTGEEQREGESLDRRLAQEVPERDPLTDGTDDGPEDNGPEEDDAGDERAGRVAVADEEPGSPVRNNRVLGRDVGIDGGAASAEEAAVHIQDDDGT
ncbi:DUF5709 domain-containing protein [Streptomyces sp. SM10]|uniref:DUF5709 domain-containing protein n=1 Tax=Streptomyces sp. SM10 TaxID=565556 RepID=UPI000CD4E20C|nr:DUF5709 domain-containing protein [Streptomyces sp. SM10]